jgi:hypothetical protein
MEKSRRVDMQGVLKRAGAAATVASMLLMQSCTLFEPREAEAPTQSGANYLPRTFPANVVSNLKTAIAQKDPVGYIACFSDSTRTQTAFSFIPSADAASIYASVLRNWTYAQELAYFQNLVAKARKPQGFASLILTPKDSIVTGNESRSYNFDYSFSFEHTESGFTQNARGSLQFTLVSYNSEWVIARWVDLQTTTNLTWSSFKGKFSN